ncbi:MAG TPA: hypothetical protein VOB72_17695, partial [Candidatus Dormibacteraeota bacterium]|nr:hypothetical protein [Candidatus Dormibacteraeota bacterium]
MSDRPMLTSLQEWLLGRIDTPTFLDRARGMGDEGSHLLEDFGRLQQDEVFHAQLLADALRAADPDVSLDHAYEMYLALTDPQDEAILRAQEAEGQPVSHIREQRQRELDALRPELGLEE